MTLFYVCLPWAFIRKLALAGVYFLAEWPSVPPPYCWGSWVPVAMAFLWEGRHLFHFALRQQQNAGQQTKLYPLLVGEIPDLFPDDEVENIINSVRNEVKGQGLVDSRDTCWKFFIERVRRQLKVRQRLGEFGSLPSTSVQEHGLAVLWAML